METFINHIRCHNKFDLVKMPPLWEHFYYTMLCWLYFLNFPQFSGNDKYLICLSLINVPYIHDICAKYKMITIWQYMAPYAKWYPHLNMHHFWSSGSRPCLLLSWSNINHQLECTNRNWLCSPVFSPPWATSLQIDLHTAKQSISIMRLVLGKH